MGVLDQEYTEWEINRMKEKYYEINNSIRTYNTKVNIKNHSTARYAIITTNTSKEVGSLWTKVHVIVC